MELESTRAELQESDKATRKRLERDRLTAEATARALEDRCEEKERGKQVAGLVPAV